MGPVFGSWISTDDPGIKDIFCTGQMCLVVTSFSLVSPGLAVGLNRKETLTRVLDRRSGDGQGGHLSPDVHREGCVQRDYLPPACPSSSTNVSAKTAGHAIIFLQRCCSARKAFGGPAHGDDF